MKKSQILKFRPAFLTGLMVVSFFSSWKVSAISSLAEINGKQITLEYFEKRYQENLKFFRHFHQVEVLHSVLHEHHSHKEDDRKDKTIWCF